MLKSSMSGENGVVWLNNSGGNLWGRVDCEFQLRLFAVVEGEALHKKGSEARAGSAAERVENQKALETRALISQLSSAIENSIDEFFSDRVVSSSIVVGSIFFSRNHLFRVKHLAILALSYSIDDSWFKIDENSSGDMSATSGCVEKSGERVILFCVWIDEFSISAYSVL